MSLHYFTPSIRFNEKLVWIFRLYEILGREVRIFSVFFLSTLIAILMIDHTDGGAEAHETIFNRQLGKI